MKNVSFFADLENYFEDIETEFIEIPESRIKILHQLGDYTISALKKDNQARLVFICTHNSRRSQFGQIWALTAAQYYGIRNIETYSGGTASTAFNPRAVGALERAGFQVKTTDDNKDNPRYKVSSSKTLEELIMFSKKYDNDANPDQGFCAILVCTDADEACPIVPGAENRISIPYDDPKVFDDTNEEKARYDERCRQIAREMFYMFRYVKTKR